MAVTSEQLTIEMTADTSDVVRSSKSVQKSLKILNDQINDINSAVMNSNDTQLRQIKSLEETKTAVEKTTDSFGFLESAISAGIIATGIRSELPTIKQFYQTIFKENLALKDSFSLSFGAASDSFKSYGKGLIDSNKKIIPVMKQLTTDSAKLGSVIGRNLGGSLIGITKLVGLATPALLTLSHVLAESDNQVLKTIAILSAFAAALTGGFAIAIGFAIKAVSNFVIALGHKLLNAMSSFEEKFVKTEQIMSQFTFTIKGFTKTLGESAVGSVDLWTEQMDRMNKSTTFTRNSIAKSIKLLVAEGTSLGLSVKQNSKILERSADIAAASGNDIIDITRKLLSSIMGNSQAVADLGIDTRAAGLAHTHYAESLGVEIESLDDAAKQQLIYNAILEKSMAVVGAATNQIQTIAGANAMYEKSIVDLQSSLGKQSSFTRAYINLLSSLIQNLNKLPPAILEGIGAIQDFLGVTLVIIGNIVKYIFTITALISAYKILSVTMAENLTIQMLFDKGFGFLGKVFNAQIVKVTSLAAVMKNLATLTKTVVIGSLKTLGSVIANLSKQVLLFTRAILVNPIFIAGAVIVASVFLLVKAVQELSEELSFVKEWFDQATSSIDMAEVKVGGFSLIIKSLKSALSGLLTVLVQVSKIFIVSFSASIVLAVKAFKKMQIAMTSNKDKIKGLKKDIKGLDDSLAELRKSAVSSFIKAADSIGTTALAAELATKKVKDLNKEIKRTSQAEISLLINKDSIDKASILTSVFGDEFEKAASKVDLIDTKIMKLRNELSKLSKGSEQFNKKIEEARKLNDESIRAGAEMIKLRTDTFRGFAAAQKDINLDALNDQQKIVEIVKLENQERLKAFDDTVKAMNKSQKLRGNELALVNKTRTAIKNLNKDILNKAIFDQVKKRSDSMKGLSDLEKTFNIQALEGENKLVAAQQLKNAIEMKAFKAKISALKEEKKFSKEELARIDRITKALQKKQAAALQQAGRGQDEAADKSKSKVPELFNKDQLDAIKNTLGEGAANMGASISSAMSPMAGAISTASMAVGALQGLVDMVPAFLNSISELINSITDLPLAIMEAVLGIFDAIKGFVANFIPNLITAIDGILTGFVDLIFDLPDIFQTMMEKIPDMILKLVNKIPVLAKKLVVGLIKFTPQIVLTIIKFFVKDVPKIAIALMKVLYVELPKALIAGIQEAMGMLLDMFTGAFDEPAKEISESFRSMGESLSGATSQMFEVMDLKAGAKAKDTADRIRDALGSSTKKAVGWLAQAWNKITDWFRDKFGAVIGDAWNFILDFFRGLGLWVSNAWKSVLDLFSDLGSIVSNAWKAILNVFNSLGELVGNAFQFVVDIFETLGSIVAMAFEAVFKFFQGFGGIISDAFKDVVDFFSGLGESIGDGLMSVLKPVFNFFIDLINGLKIPEVKVGGKVLGKKFNFTLIPNLDLIPGEIAKFAKGGHVAAGTDTVPAMLTPGEFVMNRGAVDSIGLGNMREINKGKLPGQTNVVKIEGMTINVTTNEVDDHYVKTRLMDTIKQELRRASIDGELILSKSGSF